jgi:hypothetical protein
MRKYLFNGAMLGVLVSGWNTIRASKIKPKDWRLALIWISWGLSVAIALGDVAEDARRRRLEADSRHR